MLKKSFTVLNIYLPNTGAPNLIKQIQLDVKSQTDLNTVTVSDFNTSLSTVDIASGWGGGTLELNDITNQMCLTEHST